jgi:DNA-binding MarR family transcriptional regulator
MAETRDATELAARLRIALVPLTRKLRQQNGPDLSASHASALASIARSGPLTVGDLAELEHVSSPMITKIAKALEERGLVTRTADPSDRRVTQLALTDEGTRRLEQSRKRKNAWLATKLRALDADELACIESAIPLIERLTDGEPGLPGRDPAT